MTRLRILFNGLGTAYSVFFLWLETNGNDSYAIYVGRDSTSNKTSVDIDNIVLLISVLHPSVRVSSWIDLPTNSIDI